MALWSNGRWLNWNLCVRAIVYLIFHSRIEKWNKEICWRLWCFCEFEKYRHFSDKYDNRLMLFLPGYVFFFLLTYIFCKIFKFIIFIFREGGGRKRGREVSMFGCLPCAPPPPGTCPSTQACVLTGTRTDDPLVCRLAPNPQSHTSQG